MIIVLNAKKNICFRSSLLLNTGQDHIFCKIHFVNCHLCELSVVENLQDKSLVFFLDYAVESVMMNNVIAECHTLSSERVDQVKWIVLISVVVIVVQNDVSVYEQE